jgi:membrane associated rhomboid family serine protease
VNAPGEAGTGGQPYGTPSDFIKKTRKDFTGLMKFYTLRDVVLLLLLPALLTVIQYTLGEDILRQLRLNTSDFRFYQVITSSYVHNNWAHYIWNTVPILALLLLQFMV